MSANYIICLQYGIENVNDGTRNVKLKIIFHIFIVLLLTLSLTHSLSLSHPSLCSILFTGLTGRV